MTNTCRICLGNSNLLNIFAVDEEIASNIMLFASVQIIEGDNLPQQICNLCKVELDICLGFKNKCEATYKILRNHPNDIKVGQNKEISHNNMHETDPGPKAHTNYQTRYLCSEHSTYHSPMELGHACNICDVHFGYKKDLKQHLKHTHQIVCESEKSKQCHFCGTCFRYDAELRRHTLIHTSIKEYDCNKCNKKFSSKGGLNKHIIRHSVSRRLPCPMCTKMFIHQSNLKDHMKVHSNKRKHSCNVCSKCFKAKRTLILHLKIHRNERDFPCPECDKAFTNKYDLIRHTKLHARMKEIENDLCHNPTPLILKKTNNGKQCELCGKCCRTISDLKKHIRVHTDERPYLCPHCEKKFKSTSSLNCHIRVHTQEKPFVCKLCGKGFAQSSNLRTHETIHSTSKPFKCCICINSFSRKRDLQRHAKKCRREYS